MPSTGFDAFDCAYADPDRETDRGPTPETRVPHLTSAAARCTEVSHARWRC